MQESVRAAFNLDAFEFVAKYIIIIIIMVLMEMQVELATVLSCACVRACVCVCVRVCVCVCYLQTRDTCLSVRILALLIQEVCTTLQDRQIYGLINTDNL